LDPSGTGFTITLNANPTGLPAGTYDGEAAVTDTGGEVSVAHAILTVTKAVALTPTTTTLAAAPTSQTAGVAVAIHAIVTPSTATGTVTYFDSTTQIGTATLSGGAANLFISTLAVGTHTLTASYSGDANDAASTSASITVTITAAANAPAILVGGVLNAASYAKTGAVGSPVAPGTLVAIFTSPLSATAASFSTATLPPALGGASVTFNGVTAPIVQVVPTGAYPFVSAQVPFEALAAGQTSANVNVVLTVNGASSAPASISIVASSPGIFTQNAEGFGQAILVNLADYTIAAPTGAGSTAHPIPRGQSAFFYVTGLGATLPAVSDGSGFCPASNGLCNATAMPTVYIGGIKTATPAYAGQAPGFPGVSQINITVPSNTPTGSAVVITVVSADGTVISNCGAINPSAASNCATIAVQ
jgi:uncharacterized protein (TIGR03437 family)